MEGWKKNKIKKLYGLIEERWRDKEMEKCRKEGQKEKTERVEK